MRFIETKEGFSIAIDHIEALERIDEFTTRVYSRFNTYEANFPYATLVAILEQEVSDNGVMQKLDAVLNQAQYFRG